MTENLRYGQAYHFSPVKIHLDFSEHGETPSHGFDRAIEMCNGAGICRKRTSGTMCPSFMVTRDETHSTRGRANALRAALSGQLPVSDFTSQRMYEVMDLCIECKACKAECPSSVDMAKIKFEFLAHYHREHGIPLRTRLFANIGRLGRLSSGPLAPMANWLLQNGATRVLMDKSLGIDRRRTLPGFARVPFDKWFRGRDRAPVREHEKGRSCVLLNDVFHNHSYPQVAIAAVEVLEAAGISVTLAGVKDEARPYISKGMVEKARAIAKETVS